MELLYWKLLYKKQNFLIKKKRIIINISIQAYDCARYRNGERLGINSISSVSETKHNVRGKLLLRRLGCRTKMNGTIVRNDTAPGRTTENDVGVHDRVESERRLALR